MPWPNASPSLSAAWPISKAGQAELARISAALASAGHAPEAFRGTVLNRLLRADLVVASGLHLEGRLAALLERVAGLRRLR
jgi:polyhydroxyalkanoate synthase